MIPFRIMDTSASAPARLAGVGTVGSDTPGRPTIVAALIGAREPSGVAFYRPDLLVHSGSLTASREHLRNWQGRARRAIPTTIEILAGALCLGVFAYAFMGVD